MNREKSLSFKKIFYFWMPLAATWLMMSVEGPFLAAIVARLAEPKYNLAAYGVAFSLALVLEAPVIMILSASTALVNDWESLRKLRNFTYTLNGLMTLLMLLLLLPVPFFFLMQKVIGLPEQVSMLTHHACIILLPWPGAIGYRRFFQGILIRFNRTRRVAYGTIVRLSAMSITALILYKFFNVEGVVVGAAALSAGVCMEAIASRLMAHDLVRALGARRNREMPATRLTYPYILRFYYPLALTTLLGLGIYPLVTFFMGQSRMALESLAVFPVINSLIFIFRSLGLSYQEVGIALMGDKNINYLALRKFATLLGLGVAAALGVMAFTPLANLWFHRISGLSPELSNFAIFPTRLLFLMPSLTVLISFQRSVLVSNQKTSPITLATVVEVTGIAIIMFFAIQFLNWVGAVAAAVALVTGRLAANAYLAKPLSDQVKKRY